MDYKDFEKLFKEDIHVLSDLIKNGDIPFELCQEAHGRLFLPSLLQISMLVHPDCTPIYFNVNYPFIIKRAGILARKAVLPYARVLKNIESIAVVVGSKEPTIKSIMDEFYFSNGKFQLLFRNPYISDEFKNEAYIFTGDESLLSSEAKDIFLF